MADGKNVFYNKMRQLKRDSPDGESLFNCYKTIFCLLPNSTSPINNLNFTL